MGGSPEKKKPSTYGTTPGARHFWLRRIHSLMGLLFGAYVTVHLIVNFTGFWSKTYQENVDKIHALEPLLPIIEIVAIFIPLAFHVGYGIYIAKAGVKFNTTRYNYGGNVRYLMQRVTAWMLLAFLVYHIGTLHKWGFALANEFVPTPKAATEAKAEMDKLQKDYDVATDPMNTPLPKDKEIIAKYKAAQEKYNKAVADSKIAPEPAFNPHNQAYQSTVTAVKTPHFKKDGKPDEAKNIIVIIVYLLGVWAAVFHWANGLWTSAIAWGLTTTARAQKRWGHACLGFWIGMMFIGTGAWYAFAIVGDPNYPYDATQTNPPAEIRKEIDGVDKKIEGIKQELGLGGAEESKPAGQ